MSAERTAEEWGRVAVSLPGWRWPPGVSTPDGLAPEPDDWAWQGWLLRLLGADGRPMSTTRTSPLVTSVWLHGCGTAKAPTLGRACIAAAEALGRWPGGDSAGGGR